MAKTTKPDSHEAAEGDDAAPARKSRKKLIFVIVLLVLLIAGAVVVYLLLTKPPPQLDDDFMEEQEAMIEAKTATGPPKFVDLGTFTANLMREEDERILQVAISLKLSDAALETRVKASAPEIQHRINMVLQSKFPSELTTIDGKNKLGEEIKGNVEYVLGLRKMPPTAGDANVAESISAPVGKKPARILDTGVSDVLFTSFIIQ